MDSILISVKGLDFRASGEIWIDEFRLSARVSTRVPSAETLADARLQTDFSIHPGEAGRRRRDFRQFDMSCNRGSRPI